MSRTPKIAALALLFAGSALGSTAPALAAAKQEAGGAKFNLSKPVQNAIAAAQAAIAKQDWATANTQLAAADAALSTDDDRYVAAEEHVQVAQATHDEAAETKALSYLVTSSRPSPEQKVQYLQVLSQIAAKGKDYATEQSALQQLATLAPNDPNSYYGLADLYSDQKNYAQALASTEKGVEVQRAANQPINPEALHNLVAFAYNAHDNQALAKYAPMLVAADPSAENWKLVIQLMRQQGNLDDQGKLDMYRLIRAANAFQDQLDYLSYADLASRHGLPGETVAVLDLAQKNGVQLNQAEASQLRSAAAPKVAADRASLAGSETTARAAATGRNALSVADAYLSYGEYQKAADLYALALQKGGVDVPTVQTRHGIALAMSGQKAAAKAAFAQVSGPRAALAGYWSAWVDHAA